MKLPPHFLLVPIITSLVSCAAPSVNLEGRKISRLDVVYEGEKTVDESRLRQFIEAKPGAIYSADLVDEDIRRLFCTGLIDDVSFVALPEENGGVVIRCTFKTRPLIGPRMIFNGNSTFSDMILAKATGLKGMPTTDADTATAIGNLEKFYHRNGYHKARISVRRFRHHGVTTGVCFEITEGSRVASSG